MKFDPKFLTEIKSREILASDISYIDPDVIQSVMLFPENSDNRLMYYKGAYWNRIMDMPLKEREEFIKNNIHSIAQISDNNLRDSLNECYNVYHSRQGGYRGSLNYKGHLAGILMYFILTPKIKNVKQAISFLKTGKDFSNYSGLKECWSKFKHVAHLWAARSMYETIWAINRREDELFPERFLGVASWMRIQLIESISQGKIGGSRARYTVENPSKVWDIKINGKPVDPIEVKFI